jgi:hypothetical protein
MEENKEIFVYVSLGRGDTYVGKLWFHSTAEGGKALLLSMQTIANCSAR